MFTAGDGATKLNHELESYGATTGSVNAWVQVPTLSATADTVIYLYYGNASAADQQNKTGVWDPNYKGVWHLSEASGNFNDSTAGANTGAATSVTRTTGEVAGGGSFDGSSSYVGVANQSNFMMTTAVTRTVAEEERFRRVWLHFPQILRREFTGLLDQLQRRPTESGDSVQSR